MMAAAVLAEPAREPRRLIERPPARGAEERGDPRRRRVEIVREAPQERPRREAPRAPQPSGAPKPIILRLKHISAESFMEVIEQLGRNEDAGRILRSIPTAMNREANAIVIVGPPEVAEFFERLVDGLDQPSEYHERMRAREMEERARMMQMHRGHPGGPAPEAREQMMRKMQMQRREMEERKARMARPPAGPRPEGPRPGEPRRGDPLRQVLARLLSAPVSRALGLDDDQIARIRDLARHFGEKAGHIRRRVAGAMRDLPPQDRDKRAPEVMRNVRGEIARMIGDLRREVFQVLRPEQREKAARLLGARPGEGGPSPERRGEPERPGLRPRRGPEDRYRPRPPRKEPPPPEPRKPRPKRPAEDRPAKKGRPPEKGKAPQKGPIPRDIIAKTIGRLLAPPMIEKLRLERPQVARIREIAEGLERELRELFERAKREVQGAEPKHRPEVARKIQGRVADQVRELIGDVHERIGRVLSPEQREMVKKLLGPPPGKGPHPPEHRKGKPERPHRDKDVEKKEHHPRDRDL